MERDASSEFREEHADGVREGSDDRGGLRVGTVWSGGDFKLGFQSGREVHRRTGSSRAQWKIVGGNRLHIDVVGEHFELDIVG